MSTILGSLKLLEFEIVDAIDEKNLDQSTGINPNCSLSKHPKFFLIKLASVVLYSVWISILAYARSK